MVYSSIGDFRSSGHFGTNFCQLWDLLGLAKAGAGPWSRVPLAVWSTKPSITWVHPNSSSTPEVKGKMLQVHLQMGGCQNYGPLLGPLDTRCSIILRTQKGTTTLSTTHARSFDHGSYEPGFLLRLSDGFCDGHRYECIRTMAHRATLQPCRKDSAIKGPPAVGPEDLYKNHGLPNYHPLYYPPQGSRLIKLLWGKVRHSG